MFYHSKHTTYLYYKYNVSLLETCAVSRRKYYRSAIINKQISECIQFLEEGHQNKKKYFTFFLLKPGSHTRHHLCLSRVFYYAIK